MLCKVLSEIKIFSVMNQMNLLPINERYSPYIYAQRFSNYSTRIIQHMNEMSYTCIQENNTCNSTQKLSHPYRKNSKGQRGYLTWAPLFGTTLTLGVSDTHP